MTVEKAIWIMKAIKEYADMTEVIDECSIAIEEISDATSMAIEALEKQIPKKAELYDEDLICPVCGADVEWKRYCEECGQHIDTGDES